MYGYMVSGVDNSALFRAVAWLHIIVDPFAPVFPPASVLTTICCYSFYRRCKRIAAMCKCPHHVLLEVAVRHIR